MLEFQEGFFEPEIREGFYVDATMKSVWAAELEVVNIIAEVCAKYNLEWYIGFGTMLGAIRHEGFVPWDDDIDLMMMRKDYMKLLEVLPDEIPEECTIRSPFSKAGYTEYHANLINGDGVSIVPDYLRKYHNCPFTVAVDIFPMDYLPRNKKERELQKSLFTLAGRVTQMARNLLGGFKIEECDIGKSEAETIREMKNGMKQLERLCHYKFDYSLIQKRDWEAIMTQGWKLANNLAMMYSEKDSDYIVMYGDYITWEHKVYPKEWFSETYSASFENFMLPIPNGYDDILKTVYGDYNIRRKGGGMHEYPYYARQLRELREYVENIEKQAMLTRGIEVKPREDKVYPSDWKEKFEGKKILLYVNGLQIYAEYGEKALDKLEESLKIFKENREKIIVWWRPQKQLKELLGLVSMDLVKRYEGILNTYKEEAWGICDESDDIERAFDLCDAYYGEKNFDLNKIMNIKPIMIESILK